MVVLKCKMCGGDLSVAPGATVGVCQYCGTTMTLPDSTNERRTSQHNRANHFRQKGEFDRAQGIYEALLEESVSDPESYWGLVLCKYGIEYVEDPATHKMVPTCNRVQYGSILEDADYLQALSCAGPAATRVYEEEARAIAAIQKQFLDISAHEEPFDVFLCYKERDPQDQRTPDSILAQEIYYALTEEGLRVFFSRITLEGKLGSTYEPYIFAALHSARVMVVVSTKPEYVNAPWVKNEWSRYLSLIRQGEDKTLIPAYRDMDPYDLPEELAALQSQNMGKLGFMQDLTEGVKKILGRHSQAPADAGVSRSSAAGTPTAESLSKRGFLFLEDGDFNSANTYFERALDLEPECARAYLGKLMVERRVRESGGLARGETPLQGSANYKRALQFASPELSVELKKWNAQILRRLEEKRAAEERERIREEERKARLAAEQERLRKALIKVLLNAQKCREKEEAQQQAERAQAEKIERKKSIRYLLIGTPIALLVVYLLSYCGQSFQRHSTYQTAISYAASGQYAQAQSAFTSLGNYKDAPQQASEAAYLLGLTYLDPSTHPDGYAASECYSFANQIFYDLGDYKDSADLCDRSVFLYERALLDEGRYDQLDRLFDTVDDTQRRIWQNELLATGLRAAQDGEYAKAMEILSRFPDKENVKELWNQLRLFVAQRVSIFSRSKFAAIRDDGTLSTVGWRLYPDTEDQWHDLTKIYCFNQIALGLRSDGSVVAQYRDYPSPQNQALYDAVSLWRDIVDIGSTSDVLLGLRGDGTLYAYDRYVSTSPSELPYQVSDWKDIKKIYCTLGTVIGLCSDGSVVMAQTESRNSSYSAEDIAGLHDIITLDVRGSMIVGLQSDGTLVTLGSPSARFRALQEKYTPDLSGCISLSLNDDGSTLAGLKADGTVVAYGLDPDGDVSSWSNIVSITAKDGIVYGVCVDGQILVSKSPNINISDRILKLYRDSTHWIGLRANGTFTCQGYDEAFTDALASVQLWQS